MNKEMSEMTLEELDAEMEALTKEEQAVVTILGLSPGQTVTAEQVELIKFFEDRTRRTEETAFDTFRRGYEAGIARAAGAETAKLIEERDAARTRVTVIAATSAWAEHHAFIRGAQICREMMARFVEQGGDAETAASIRANWRPSWDKDPGRPAEDYYATAAPCDLRERAKEIREVNAQ